MHLILAAVVVAKDARADQVLAVHQQPFALIGFCLHHHRPPPPKRVAALRRRERGLSSGRGAPCGSTTDTGETTTTDTEGETTTTGAEREATRLHPTIGGLADDRGHNE